jgi:cyclopropane fatty-acyl-phospholipid synthase-like methyltransferase
MVMTAKMSELYNSFVETYEMNRVIFDIKDIITEFDNVSGVSTGDMLQLGVGAGGYTTDYYVKKGWTLTGVDFSEKMLETFSHTYPTIKTILSDMTKVTLPSESFDVVMAVYALFHTDKNDHKKLFKDIYNWLKPNGWTLFTYAGVDYTGYETFSGYIEFMGIYFYYSHLTEEDLHDALVEVGFKHIYINKRNVAGETFLWVTCGK